MKRIIKMNTGKGKMIRMVFHNDAGHEWLSCKKKLLNDLGLSEKISAFSYQKGKTAYLEGDLDAQILIEKLMEENYSFLIVDGAYRSSSPIRNYERFTK